jgi:hypothetical protein
MRARASRNDDIKILTSVIPSETKISAGIDQDS